MVFRSLKPHQLVIDVVVAAVCFTFPLPIYLTNQPLAVVVLAGMAAALAIRRMSPPIALVIAWLTALVQLGLSLPPDVSNLAILPVLYASAAYGGAAIRWSGLASSGAGALVIAIYLPLQANIRPGGVVVFGPPSQVLGFAAVTFVGSLAMLGLSWTLGLLGRTRRLARESREAEHVAELARMAAQQETRAEQERGRIGREMHDVVAHSLAVVVAQADGARYAVGTDPALARESLEVIATTARSALSEVRTLLERLRHDQGEGPQPGLADIATLVDRLRGAGLDVELHETGSRLPMGAGQQLAVYRVLQESLTNALRHASSPSARVNLAWSEDGVSLTVENESEPVSASGEQRGHGVAGMRERAALSGGFFRAERVEGRYVVRAVIPPSPADGSVDARTAGAAS